MLGRVPQHGIHRMANSYGQIPLGRQRLGTGYDAAFILDQHRVCTGPARVYAQKNGHVNTRLWIIV